ncbi:hypothetical protein AB0M28_16915 [Streptomyces sp. NPDC051940]|uniref:hypothetical protein n=1 Tax=Streptomyces sp. NPDC051940 TaxID=3155675 RepID=UPI0034349959
MSDAWSLGRRGRFWLAVPLVLLFGGLALAQWRDTPGDHGRPFAQRPPADLPEGTARYADCGKGELRRSKGTGLVVGSYGYSNEGGKGAPYRFTVGLGVNAPRGERLGPAAGFRVRLEFWGAHGEGLLARAEGLRPVTRGGGSGTGASPSARPDDPVDVSVELPLSGLCAGLTFWDLMGPHEGNDAADTPPLLATVEDPATGLRFTTAWPPETPPAPTLQARAAG